MRLEQLEDRLALSTGAVGTAVAAVPATGAGTVHAADSGTGTEPPTGIPGSAIGSDPFKIGFDENGNAVFQIFNTATGHYNPPVRALAVFGGQAALTYILPELVVPGDVKVVDANGVGDLLRFVTSFATGTSVMQYFSDGGDTDVADIGVPFSTTPFSVTELGPQGLNFFNYVAGSGNRAFTNFYDGVSDFTEIQSPGPALPIIPVGTAPVAAPDTGAPGSPIGSGADPFKFGFDENGHAVYQIFNAATGQYGPPVRAASGLVGGVLTYLLPEDVVTGDVKVLDPEEGVSDLLRFGEVRVGGVVLGTLQYYSDAGDTDLADTGVPASTTAFSVTELGPEGLNFFEWLPGGGPGPGNNIYDGISDITEIQRGFPPI
jgi:hypothetical protein